MALALQLKLHSAQFCRGPKGSQDPHQVPTTTCDVSCRTGFGFHGHPYLCAHIHMLQYTKLKINLPCLCWCMPSVPELRRQLQKELWGQPGLQWVVSQPRSHNESLCLKKKIKISEQNRLWFLVMVFSSTLIWATTGTRQRVPTYPSSLVS